MHTPQQSYRAVLHFLAAALCWWSLSLSWAYADMSSQSHAGASAGNRPGTLQSVLQKGTLRVGVSLFTPWTLKTADGELAGFEIDVAKQLAKDLGVKPVFHVLDWEKMIPALLSRNIDIIVAGIVITPQRALKVNFSDPYDSSGIGLVTNIALTKTFRGPSE